MHIVSWNVAGLSTTLQRIDADYGASSLAKLQQQSGAKPARCHAFAYYLQRHAIDILCIQEHKIPYKQLSSRSEPMGCSSLPGYESFWSCCTDKNSKGMNGVVTYAKVGTSVSANSTPFGDEELDSQGRCVQTDHGSFIIFNVYVPQGGSCGINFKLKFLYKLRAIMNECRQKLNKPVILVGDLNIAHQSIDVFWKYRQISIDRVLLDARVRADQESSPTDSSHPSVPRWRLDVAKHWSDITAALETKRAVDRQTTNTSTGEKFDKFCTVVTVNGKDITLGKAECTKESALSCYDLFACTYFDEEANEERLAKEANIIYLDTLTELMCKICGVEWNESMQRLIASTDDCLYHASPTIDWFKKIINDDQMVDAFRLYYANAVGRFTCWHQYTNKRYVNEGSRIDYTLVDKKLVPYIQQRTALRCCDVAPEDPFSEDAALKAATACGRYKAASFDGSGIGDANQEALDMQFGPVHTGMIYTPPSYSDHIAIALVLQDIIFPMGHCLQLDDTDRVTRKAQPHRSQSSIKTFFTADGNRRKLSVSHQNPTGSTASCQSTERAKALGKTSTADVALAKEEKTGGEIASNKIFPSGQKRAGAVVLSKPRGSKSQRTGGGTLQSWFQKYQDKKK